MHAAPKALTAHIETLAGFIRDEPVRRPPLSARRYRVFLRDNIRGVLTQTFASFCRCTDPGLLDGLIERFLAEHDAEAAEFHHIATEFVRFAQRADTLPRTLLCLLEYEWSVFQAEIDDSQVAAPSPAWPAHASDGGKLRLFANPTLTCLELPFPVERVDNASCPLAQGAFLYAVYRNSRHHVLTQPLQPLDVWLLTSLSQRAGSSGISYRALSTHCKRQHLDDDMLWTWLTHSHNINLIGTHRKDEP